MQQLQPNITLQGGKYRIERMLGQGGYGITYEGLQTGLNRRVAIKEFFLKEYCEREGQTSHVTSGTTTASEIVAKCREKFIKEAQMIASFDRAPHIVRIYDIFEENGTAYYVMEYVEGGSLTSLVEKSGPLPVSRAINLINQTGQALSYLHSRQTMHLDVKPANLLLRREDDGSDNVVLIDFGISKHYDAQGHATTTSFVTYSRGFASLEQYREGGVQEFSPTSDIYSLGATLYFLLTGQTPPDAMLLVEDPLERPSTISPDLWPIISRAMSTSRKKRYQTVDEMMQALKEVKKSSFPIQEKVTTPVQNEETIVARKASIEATLIDKKKATPSYQKPASRTNIQKPEKRIEESSSPLILNSEKSHSNKLIYFAGLVVIVLLFAALYTKESGITPPQNEIVDRVPQIKKSKKEIISSLISNMVEIEGGYYVMGTTDEQREIQVETNSDFQKPHKEKISTFWLGKYEVTQEEWEVVMGTNPSFSTDIQEELEAALGMNPSLSTDIGTTLPVNCVSWNDCQTFINKLNQITGLKFRFPTEAEWEYAARGGRNPHNKIYSGSDDMDEIGWFHDLHSVGGKQPNSLGLYDMTGNVAEWCEDIYWDYSYGHEKVSGDLTDISRMYRGGGYLAGREWTISYRWRMAASEKSYSLGLRLAMDK